MSILGVQYEGNEHKPITGIDNVHCEDLLPLMNSDYVKKKINLSLVKFL